MTKPTMTKPKNKTQRNVIRVFLSSTFRDMAKEREYLNKVIFPEVRQATRERGVEFSAIDLRWGVTEDEANQGDENLCRRRWQIACPHHDHDQG